jgi:hypothetical protein
MSKKVKRRVWTWSCGPHRRRVRLFQEEGRAIYVEIRDWRQPLRYRYRMLSLNHADRERAKNYAKVLVLFWRVSGRPPSMSWRRGRGPLPKEAAA